MNQQKRTKLGDARCASKIYFSLLLLGLSFQLLNVSAQVSTRITEVMKKNQLQISVSGSAEQEVTPDRIFFALTLGEYADKRGNKVNKLKNVEKEFFKICKREGINKDKVTIENASGFRDWRQRKKGETDFLATEAYLIEFKSLSKVNPSTESLSPEAIRDARIRSYEYSKMSELKAELQVQAAKNARLKAVRLAGALDAEITHVLSISEGAAKAFQPNAYAGGMATSMMRSAAVPDSEFKSIKVKASVNVSFGMRVTEPRSN